MAQQIVTIEADGTLDPSKLRVQPGDTITFKTEKDTVLCVDPGTTFGAERYEIPARQLLTLTVQRTAGSFDMVARVGDLTAPCKGGRATGREGSGEVGGGPG